MFDLIRAWWRADRIRVRPNEGRLLRLRPGSLLLIEGRPVELAGRSLAEDAERPCVVYDCISAGGTARLSVRLTGPQEPLTILWSEHGEERELDEQEIVVLR